MRSKKKVTKAKKKQARARALKRPAHVDPPSPPMLPKLTGPGTSHISSMFFSDDRLKKEGRKLQRPESGSD